MTNKERLEHAGYMKDGKIVVPSIGRLTIKFKTRNLTPIVLLSNQVCDYDEELILFGDVVNERYRWEDIDEIKFEVVNP